MIKAKLEEILRDTDAIFQTDVDFNKEVTVTEDASNVDGDSLLFLTHLASGEQREIRLSGTPYAIVCEEDDAKRLGSERLIITDNSRIALAYAYRNLYKISRGSMKYVAVTGTNGKTTVAEMICSILKFTGADVGYIGTGTIRINDTPICEKYYSMTTPDPDLLYRSIKDMELFGCKYVVIEASSHGLALGKLAPLEFDVGIFTNLSEEHRDFHPTMSDYLEAKLSLFDKCEVGIFNLDCPYSARAYELATCKKESVGIINRGDVYATDIQLRGIRGSYFYYRENGLIFGVDLALAGAFNIYNSLMALRCAIDLGIKPCIAKRAINCLSSIEGRMEIFGNEVSVVIDYAHTPLAVENTLKTLYSAKKPRQSLYLVIGCGGERDRKKRAEIGRIAEKYVKKIYITEDNSRNEDPEQIITDIMGGVKDPDAAVIIPSRAEAIRQAILNAERGDIIAILGKGRECYMITSDGYTDFSDKQEALSALRLRKAKNETNA